MRLELEPEDAVSETEVEKDAVNDGGPGQTGGGLGLDVVYNGSLTGEGGDGGYGSRVGDVSTKLQGKEQEDKKSLWTGQNAREEEGVKR